MRQFNNIAKEYINALTVYKERSVECGLLSEKRRELRQELDSMLRETGHPGKTVIGNHSLTARPVLCAAKVGSAPLQPQIFIDNGLIDGLCVNWSATAKSIKYACGVEQYIEPDVLYRQFSLKFPNLAPIVQIHRNLRVTVRKKKCPASANSHYPGGIF